MEDAKIWAMAHLIVKEHGDQAVFFAIQHADVERANRNHASLAVWTRIIRVIEELQRRSREGERLN